MRFFIVIVISLFSVVSYANVPRVAVLPIYNENTQTESPLQSTLQTQIQNALTQKGLNVTDPAEVERVAAVFDMTCLTVPCLSKIAEALNADAVVGGTIRWADEKGTKMYYLDLWLMDDQKATITKLSEKCILCSEASLQKWSRQVLDRLVVSAWGKEEEAQKGYLVIRSIPDEAEIIANGSLVGMTNTEIRVPPGKQHIKVVKKGFFEQTKDVSVEPQEKATLSFVLKKDNSNEEQERRSSLFKALKWSTLGVAAASLATGITFSVVDGNTSCDASRDTETCDVANSKALGISFIVVGSLSAIASGLLFYFK